MQVSLWSLVVSIFVQARVTYRVDLLAGGVEPNGRGDVCANILPFVFVSGRVSAMSA